MNKRSDILWRVYISFFLIGSLGLLIIYQAGKIQFGQGGYWREMADSLTLRYLNIEPTRGNIYAADGSLMAASLPVYDIRLDLKSEALTDEIFESNVHELSIRLSEYFGDRSAAAYERLLRQKRKEGARYYKLLSKISHKELKDIKEFPLFELGKFKGGFIVEERSYRKLPFGSLAERTIGYKNPHITGVGLEGAYNTYLAGNGGKRLMQKVAGGEWIPVNSQNELEPEEGKDVHSTIDMNLQDMVENALLKALERNEAHHGCAVVMEVKTGHIRAISNLERTNSGTYAEKYNFAVGESAEPGSTFKLASALVLLENDVIDTGDLIDTKNGKIKFYDRTMSDAKEGGYGEISFGRAFALSSNVAFSKVVYDEYRSNPQPFIDELKDLHISDPLGLPIAGEGLPKLKEPGDEDWYGTTLPWMSIGYELTQTPLKTLALYNAIANDGKMIRPLFASEINEVGKTVRQFEPEVIEDKICSDETLQKLKTLLEDVVKYGTGSDLKPENYTIAGKTGTNQIAGREGSGYKSGRVRYQASFVGYFPTDAPKYSCIVVVNSPKKGLYYGSSVAGPVFKEIADKIYANSLNVREDFEKYAETEPELPPVQIAYAGEVKPLLENFGLKVKNEHEILDYATVDFNAAECSMKNVSLIKGKVPDVKGLSLKDALYLLENEGLHVAFQGHGKVYRQSILPGADSKNFESITIYLN